MPNVSIQLSMYDRSRRAEVTLPDSTMIGELMDQCQMRWSLPADSFAIRDVRRNRLLPEHQSIAEAGIDGGSELQIFPLVEGGRG
jgi:hypothetical protein